MRLELKIVDLLARNLEKKFTINEVARVLKEHYSLVHRIVNRLLEKGIIAKEKIGKSYICSLNLDNENTPILIQLSEADKRDNFLNSDKELKLILEDFAKSVESQVNMVSMVLFGSYAKHNATKESDIDILLISREKAGIDKVTRGMYAKYGKEINTIVMSPNDFRKQKHKDLIKEIINNHYIIYGIEKFVDMVYR